MLAGIVAACGAIALPYSLLYGAAVSPGVELGRRAFGSRHPAGWAVGALLGYGTTQIALWLPIYLGVAHASTFIASWTVQAIAVVAVSRRIESPVITLPAWSTADTRAAAVTLLLVPLLMGPPYRNLGREDESGARHYRAYFTADFVWHTALAAELRKFESPPRNPYMASSPMHYYWTYFLLPAVAAGDDVQSVLKANAMLSAPLLIVMMYLLARAAVPRAGPAAVAVALGVLATSAEGSYELAQIWAGGAAAAELKDTNIDAISSWRFQGLRIDGIARGLWYNPQHSLACALALVAALIAAASGAAASRPAVWLAGAALGLATTFNPFVGGVFCLVYGVSVAWDALGRPRAVTILLRHAIAAVPVLLALAWCSVNEVADDAGAGLRLGWLIGLAGNNTLQALLVSTGSMMLPALAGFWPVQGLPAQPLRVAAAGVVASLLLMHGMTISEPSWVGFRTGQILQLLLPVLLARVLWALARRSRILPAALALAVLTVGLPTTAIDLYNTQDIGNRSVGPGFRWTQSITAEQQSAFAWLRMSVPADAVVQMEPVVRGFEHWSLIPTFAERRMSAGLPISLLPTPENQRRSQDVQQLFRTADAREARDRARAFGIDYLYVDGTDRAAYPEGTAKFDGAPEYFERVYNRGGISFYRVR
jgi:hypothetical protein